MKHNEARQPSHKQGCRCAICDAVAMGLTPEEAWQKLEEREREAVIKHGWYAHFVQDDGETHYGVNVHSHGMEAYDHLDFQVVFPIDERLAHHFIADLIERVKKGEKFQHGQRVSQILKNYDILLLEANEAGRAVLRLILPDEEGNLTKEDIKQIFRGQFEGTLDVRE